MNVPGNYPLYSTTNAAGGKEPGLADLVQRALNTGAPCMTVEQVQRLGSLDPVAEGEGEAHTHIHTPYIHTIHTHRN